MALIDGTGQCIRRGAPGIDLALFETPAHVRAVALLKVIDRFYATDRAFSAAEDRALDTWVDEGDPASRAERVALRRGRAA